MSRVSIYACSSLTEVDMEESEVSNEEYTKSSQSSQASRQDGEDYVWHWSTQDPESGVTR